MKEEIMFFQGNEVEIIWINREPLFEIYSTGKALGHIKEAKGRLYPRKDRIDESIKNAEITPVVHDGQLWFSESQLYDFMFEIHTDKVKPFKKWVTTKVLPSIRKTGAYFEVETKEKLQAAILKGIAGVGNIVERTMKAQGSEPTDITKVLDSLFKQNGLVLPEEFVKVEEWKQMELSMFVHIN